MNALSILSATPEDIDALSMLPCVSSVDVVTRFIRPRQQQSQQHEQESLSQSQSQSPNSHGQHINNINNIKHNHDNDNDNNNNGIYGLAYDQLNQINVIPVMERGYNGSGVTVLIVDSGFQQRHVSLHRPPSSQHPLTVVDTFDFVNNDTNVDNDSTDDYHGTQCLGLMAAYHADTYISPAYGARYLLAKTEDVPTESSTEEDNFVRAIEWGLERGAQVLSASLGYAEPMYTPKSAVFNGNATILSRAINRASIDHGLICVVAMGNEGPDAMTLTIPSDSFHSISVGAVDIGGNIARFSSRGPTFDRRIKPEVCGPGANTVVINPASTSTYRRGSGTSFATPLVAASVVLLKQMHPEWTLYQVREALMQTASNAHSPNNDFGWGIINVDRASKYYPGACSGKGQPMPAGDGSDSTVCQCVNGWFGAQCEYMKSTCESTCRNGLCLSHTCTCYSGWRGTNCDLPSSAAPLSSSSQTTASRLCLFALMLIVLYVLY